ncbi:hypothetical protein TCE0_015r02372 [Talaromyces pinophilus]|uniref:Uncharacterized protein n=1 Tax=Talaromyces pinophilus TaxID=128442 RepID=A0A6V8H0L2_TALPI|nr:hypothetical protein TCE0_015r02372 [Talaromyces pinophilus]
MIMDADTLISSIKFGGLSGCTGLLYGGASGILRASKHPVVHTLAHGIHFSIWGTSFWFIRSNILHFHYQNEATQQQRKYVSAISGGLSGGAITRLMGAKFTPGFIVFSLVGYLGQTGFNVAESWHQENAGKEAAKPKSILERMAASKWIPLRALSDDDFRDILKEKVLSIEVEIALLDDKIRSLEEERAASAASVQKGQDEGKS